MLLLYVIVANLSEKSLKTIRKKLLRAKNVARFKNRGPVMYAPYIIYSICEVKVND